MSKSLIWILSLIEYVSFWKILVIYEDDRILATRLIQALNQDSKVDTIVGVLSNVYNIDSQFATQLAQEFVRFYEYLESSNVSQGEMIEVLTTIFYVFSKKFPSYYKDGEILWNNLYRDFSLFDAESRDIRSLIKSFPQSMESIKQESEWNEDITSYLRATEIDTLVGAVVKVVTLYDVWKFISVTKISES